MSRLIVKNLPPYLTQDRFRAYFESSDGPGGTLTDAKLVLQPNGTSRRFGFIGYRTPAEAQRAQKWFNRTFIDSSRIAVEVVDVRHFFKTVGFIGLTFGHVFQGVKNAPQPRPNKRPRLEPEHVDSLDNTKTEKSEKPLKKDSKLSDSKKAGSSSQLDEFMQIMKPRTKKGPSWANDDVVATTSKLSSTSLNEAGPSSPKKVRSKAAVAKGSETPVTESDSPEEAIAEQEPISDMDWLKQRQKSILESSPPEKAYEQSEDEVEEEPEADKVYFNRSFLQHSTDFQALEGGR